ncbi:penicillin-binding transpeptidase domain-containing protein [Criblamydia sequanensis]|uniref:Beta-lactamase n=1 Tax=Candidatus Criblamydia sequanensis CRIB-18 TaxID=1437425 RepID=A0A090E2N8_9BACT|nr:penicillin-binding transpeptidase domain-containing protein [Criblamydia sequanensis]CDR34909.1 Putative beta-lactamase [Criblamydia sequanensis CRIB-18]
MIYELFLKRFLIILFLSAPTLLSTEENFILVNGITKECILSLGENVDEPITPCSTFKIALSLMGFDAEILLDSENPVWEYEEGYDDYLECWKSSQTPLTWIKRSCVWYSKLLANFLGLDKINHYLALFEYGNQDMSGGLKKAWLSSSLKISTREQAYFIQKLVSEAFPISVKAQQITQSLLFIEDLPDGSKLFGKTGLGTLYKEPPENNLEVGWFVGWVEKEDRFFPFAYHIREKSVNTANRIGRAKELLSLSNVL